MVTEVLAALDRMTEKAVESSDWLSEVGDLAENLAESEDGITIALGTLGSLGMLLTALLRIRGINERQRRYPCDIKTLMKSDNHAQSIQVIDIGRGGAKLQSEDDTDIGQLIEIRLGGNWVKGKTIWNNNTFAGVAFNRTMPADELKTLIGNYS